MEQELEVQCQPINGTHRRINMTVEWHIADNDLRYANLPQNHQLTCEWSGKSWFVWLNRTYCLAGDKNEFEDKRLALEGVEKWIAKFDETYGLGGKSVRTKDKDMATATVNKAGKATTAPAKTEANGTEEEEPKKKAPPKDPKSLTIEEIDAGIEGTLEMREKKGDTEQLGLSGAQGVRGPTGRPIGLITGLPIQGAWLYLFGENNHAPEKPAKIDQKTGLAVPGSGKMTDEQLSAHMKADFPGRTNKTFDNVNGARRVQQVGQATGGKPLNYVSYMYDKDANVITGKKKKEKAEAGAEEPEEVEEVEELEEEEEKEPTPPKKTVAVAKKK